MELKKPLDDYLGVEYKGRKALIRRDPSYRKTIQHIQNIFGIEIKVNGRERLILSVYVGELEDHFEIQPKDWHDLLPRINCAVVSFVSCRTRSPSVIVISDSEDGSAPARPPRVPAPNIKMEKKDIELEAETVESEIEHSDLRIYEDGSEDEDYEYNKSPAVLLEKPYKVHENSNYSRATIASAETEKLDGWR
ncbi:hypothetical protein RhiJN_24073 [Ceratobasidium sp. AG-Ba]|nr:hypothetical protein RhiJN_24073 [Ceratobasidium sp. AG-Ba]